MGNTSLGDGAADSRCLVLDCRKEVVRDILATPGCRVARCGEPRNVFLAPIIYGRTAWFVRSSLVSTDSWTAGIAGRMGSAKGSRQDTAAINSTSRSSEHYSAYTRSGGKYGLALGSGRTLRERCAERRSQQHRQSLRLSLEIPGAVFRPGDKQLLNMARDYSPDIGRYVEADPLITRGDTRFVTEAYSYAADNSLTYIDPYGLWTYNGPPSKTGRLAGEAPALANCLEDCLGRPFVVTGGSECEPDGRHTPDSIAKNSRHCTNQAIDIRPTGNKTKAFCCAKKCGAAGLGVESNHWHFQTDGNHYGAPDTCECKKVGVDL